jgi:hypothetical protein
MEEAKSFVGNILNQKLTGDALRMRSLNTLFLNGLCDHSVHENYSH